MSYPDRAERIFHLRQTVARLESGPHSARARRVSLTRALDARLGGGLSGDGLHEIAPAAPADAPAAFGFALSLAARFMAQSEASALLAGEDFALTQEGPPFGPGLVAHGVDLSRIVFVRAPDAASLFQTLEDAARSGGLAVAVGEVWRLARYDLAVSRRLALAARAGGTPMLLTMPTGHDAKHSSAAETRFRVAAAPSAHEAAAGRPVPGAAAVSARLVKARGGGEDEGRAFRLVWRSEERKFDDPAISVPLAAEAGDRSRAKSA